MLEAWSESAPGERVPLRIAVTGHRDLDPADVAELRATIERLCGALLERLPGVHAELVSGMADGADRIAAQAALAAGFRVHALLPMPLDMYLGDFDEASRSELLAMLADPRVTRTELELPEGIDRETASVPGWARDALYVALAERLRRGASLLLAVWDGEDRGLPGGTGDTVLRFLGLVTNETARAPRRLGLQPATEDVAEGERPVFWLRARRRGSATESTGVAGFLGITDDGDVAVVGRGFPKGLEEELETLVDYARDAARHVDPGSHPWGLVSDDALALRPDAESALRLIDREYRRADLLAVHHQQRSDRLFKAFSMMAATMGLLFLAYAKLYPGKVFLAGYLALFIAGIGLYAIARRRGWFSRHLMYRAIAESLRTRFYLSVAGIPSRGVEQHLMRLLGVRRIAGFSWIGHILRATTPFELGATSDPGRCMDWVRKAWLEDQHRYFERKAHALHHAHERLERFKIWVLCSMVIAIVALMLLKSAMAAVAFGLPVKTYVVFLLGLVPLWLGIWEIYQTKMATKELGWQYQNQRFHLEQAVRQLEHAGSVKRSAVILGETAERLLADTYLWTVQRFHREHEPPAAG